MRNKILLIAIFSFVNITAQKSVSSKLSKSLIIYNYEVVYKWEGITKNNVLVFGVEPTENKAKAIISDFNDRNWRTNYRILHYNIKKDTVRYIGKEDYFKVFKRRFPKGYHLLSVQEQMATDIYMKEGLLEAINYYRKSKQIPYPSAKEHLENLLYNLSQYRINFKFNPKGQSN